MKKLISGISFSLFLIAGLLFVIGVSEAQEGMKGVDLPKSGVLSDTFASGRSGVTAPGTWGDSNVLSSDPAPISGSVSKLSNNKWQMRLFNNSEDPYSVSVEVRQIDTNRVVQRRDTFSYTLKPKQSVEREVTAYSPGVDCALELLKWKNLSPPKKKEEAANGVATPTGEQSSARPGAQSVTNK